MIETTRFPGPLLAHEFGHYLDSKHQVSIPLADQFVEISFKPPTPEERKTWQGIFRPLASELFADLTCYYLLGPVSILPIVNMELNFGMATDTPIPFDHVHPLTSTRLQVISETAAAEEMSLDVFSSYVRALEEDENEKAAKLNSVQQRERATIKEYTKFFAVRLRAELLERIADLGLKKFDATALGTAVQLTKALEQGIPVGSKRRHADSEIRSVLASLTSTSAVEQSQAAFNMFKEVPVTVPEVLSAGWIAKSNQRVDWLKKGFAEKAVDRIFPTMKSALEHQDRLLIKSIETVAVVGGVTDVA